MSFPTPDQQLAINTRDRSVLLSAAAGSGKTATLTRRIIESLTADENPLSLDRMLIVTFTKAAAAELRERISSALSEALSEAVSDELSSTPDKEKKIAHLTKQTVLLGSADISTIDSFCLDVVRANFEHLKIKDKPLPPDFRLADETELKTLSLTVMNSVIDRWYAKTDDGLDFPKFAENFSTTRGEGTLVETLIKYNVMLESVPDPDSFTKNQADRFMADAELDFFKTELGKKLKAYVKGFLEYSVNIFERAISDIFDGGAVEDKYGPAFKHDLEVCRYALSALEVSYERAREVFNSYKAEDLGRLTAKDKTELTDKYKELRTNIRDEIREINKKYFSLPQESVSEMSRRTASELYTLAELIKDFREEYIKEKLLRRVCEFSDIKAFAHKLLVNPDGSPTELAFALQSKYDAVYIDEYQDVDAVQNEIFTAVSRKGVCFTVGDIKQSIYGFRGAEPDIFGKMRESIPDYGTKESDETLSASLFMSENFRCDESIIKFVNEVSAHTFVPAGGVVGYRKEDDLRFGKGASENIPVKISLFTNEKDDDGNSPEVPYAVNEIKRLLAIRKESPDKKENGGQSVEYKYGRSDIAILCRSRKLLNAISDSLNAEGIATIDESAKDFFGNPEILLALSLITAIDNPQKDIPLASVMRSPFFGFSMDELIAVRQGVDPSYSLFEAVEAYAEADISDALAEKCAAFSEEINNLRADARTLSVDRFVRLVYRKFGIMSMQDVKKKRSQSLITTNLRRFYEYARAYSSTQSGGLSGFISYINGIIETEAQVKAPSLASPEGAVVLSTIHGSKGLEFPVVFLVGCGKYFNKEDLKKSLIFDPAAGVALMPIDETGFARTDTPQRAALAIAITEKQTEEEMRLLYVALTRAKERLYITSASQKAPQKILDEAKLTSDFECRSSVLSANSYIKWVAAAVAKEQPFFEVYVNEPIEDADVSNGESKEPAEKNEEKIKAARALISENLDYKYPYSYAKKLPSKLSVSRLYPDMLDDDGTSELDSDKLPELRERPLFLMGEAKATAAEKGTATHVFMQFCDFERAEKSVREELSRLVTERFIPEGTSKLVNVPQLETFFESKFYKTVRSAQKIYRELRFNMLLPASEFSKDTKKYKNDKILVQGVIDLLMIDANGNVVLCDYKTDYLTPDELADESKAKKKLFDRHGQQLKYYAAAAEQLLGKVPDRICIYSLPLGRAIDMN